MTYQELADEPFSSWRVSATVIAAALRKRGYRRCKAISKPIITQRNREIRLKWAYDHLHWTQADWYRILWSDETYIKIDDHRDIYITRRPDEELDPTCLRARIRANGLMVWGSFHGITRGPCIIWEKSWGSINQKKYRDIILPLVINYLQSPCDPPAPSVLPPGAPLPAALSTATPIRLQSNNNIDDDADIDADGITDSEADLTEADLTENLERTLEFAAPAAAPTTAPTTAPTAADTAAYTAAANTAGLIFMQDNAPPHSARETMRFLHRHDIVPIH